MRVCGECTACCTVMGVPELNKPGGVPCSSCEPKGCKVYDSRPPSCREFECLWRQDLFAPAHRPDLLGLMFTVTEEENKFGKQLLVAFEVRPNAFEDNKAMLLKLSEQQLVLLRNSTGLRVIGPQMEIEAAEKFVGKRLPVLR